MIDCCFTSDNNWFRYRAAAIIVEEDCVLFVTNENEDYYYSVGGGVHIHETAIEAVKREVLEETGVSYEIDRLAVIHENFFDQNEGTLKGLKCHEITFYFLMKPKGSKDLNSNSYTHNAEEVLCWLPIKDLEKYKAYPTFLKVYLKEEHEGIMHIVTKDYKKKH